MTRLVLYPLAVLCIGIQLDAPAELLVILVTGTAVLMWCAAARLLLEALDRQAEHARFDATRDERLERLHSPPSTPQPKE